MSATYFIVSGMGLLFSGYRYEGNRKILFSGTASRIFERHTEEISNQGNAWSREDKLSLRDRSIVTVVALLSQGLTCYMYHDM